MSNEVFPTLPGIKISVSKIPVWKTKVQESVSGKEIRGSFMSYPNWEFKLQFEFLRSIAAYGELQSLLGFFNRHRGMFDSFLFTDPEDNAVTAHQFGVGDGSTTAFQITRTWGNFTEPVQNLNGSPSIYKAGVLQATPADYTISSTGVVTFTTAPANGAVLTWTGSYYFRVRFKQDSLEATQLLKNIWEAKKVEFRSIKL